MRYNINIFIEVCKNKFIIYEVYIVFFCLEVFMLITEFKKLLFEFNGYANS